MRLWIFLLIVAVLGLIFGFGITVIELGASPAGTVDAAFTAHPAVVDEHGPKATVDSEEYDFGAMERDSYKSHTFVIRNDGHAPLTLIKGDSTCRCTTFEVEKTDLQPGESTNVKIEWHATVPPGQFGQSAKVNTNDPSRPQISFSIKGKVTFSHTVSPDNLVFTGISANQPHTAEVKIYSYRPGQLEVIASPEFSDTKSADKFDISFKPMPAEMVKENPEATSGVLATVTVKPGLPLGMFRQKIDMRLNLEGEPVVSLPIEGNVVSDILVIGRNWDDDHSLLTLGNISAREGAKAQLFILANGPHRQQVHPKVREVSPEMLKVKLGEPSEIAGGEQVRIPVTIEIPPGARPSVHLGGSEGSLGEIVLDTGLPEAATMKIRVRFAIEE